MGQKPSGLGGRFGNNRKLLKLPWTLRGPETTRNPNPEQPIKFQYKTRRKSAPSEDRGANNTSSKSGKSAAPHNLHTLNNLTRSNQIKGNEKNTNLQEVKCRIVKTQNAAPPARIKSEPNLGIAVDKTRHRHRKNARTKNDWTQQFGYEIQDVDAFLTKATIEKPANIPVVLAFPSILYQTRTGGYQAEISLPLGMVVNAVFKNQHWLYVQTPHAEEGYVSYAACLPLGIIPPPDDDAPAPCWENNTDVFPKPSGNMTDTEKLSSKSECGGDGGRCQSRRSRNAVSTCGERSVDRLYLRAAASAKKSKTIRETLLVIISDYYGGEKNALGVRKGDVVVLLGTHVRGWFWVRNKEGGEGFIPAAVAGHGFL